MKRPSNISRILLRGAIACACALSATLVPACGGPGGASSAVGAGQAQALSLPFGGGAGGSGGSGGNSGGGAGGSQPTGASFDEPTSIAVAELAPDSGGSPAIASDHAEDGYVTAQASSPARLKFQVKLGDQTYNYDLPNDGTQTVFPLNMGSGSYTFRIMQNTSGSNYVELFAASVDVALADEFAPFLVPNVFCDYDAKSESIAKARELVADASNCAQVVQEVCTFVAGNVSYDNAKAERLAQASGYMPDPDETLETGKGICLDYASLSAAMLRSMGIPTKLMTGYVGSDEVYHAWIMVYVDGSWQNASFKVEPKSWSRCDVTFASTGATKYVGDASAYVDRYTY